MNGFNLRNLRITFVLKSHFLLDSSRARIAVLEPTPLWERGCPVRMRARRPRSNNAQFFTVSGIESNCLINYVQFESQSTNLQKPLFYFFFNQ